MPVKIIHYISSLNNGGIQAYLLNVYRYIDHNTVQFDFIVSSTDKPFFSKEVIESGSEIFTCPKLRFYNVLSYCFWWHNFLKLHPCYKIIHGHIRSSAWIYLTICKAHHLTTVIHSHSTSNGKGFLSVIKYIFQYPIRFLADYYLSCTTESGVWLYGRTASNSPRFEVFPNCIIVSKYLYDADARLKVRRELRIQDDVLVVGHVGRFHRSKNHVFLLRVFREICIKTNAVLLLIGNGSTQKHIRFLTRLWKIENRVIFINDTYDAASYYSAMDAFVFPSLWEGFPLAVIEAQANGLPVVLSDSITSEAVLTEKTIRLSLMLSPKKWAETILQIAHNADRNLSSDDLGRIQKFDSRSNASLLQSFYLKIAENITSA